MKQRETWLTLFFLFNMIHFKWKDNKKPQYSISNRLTWLLAMYIAVFIIYLHAISVLHIIIFQEEECS